MTHLQTFLLTFLRLKTSLMWKMLKLIEDGGMIEDEARGYLRGHIHFLLQKFLWRTLIR